MRVLIIHTTYKVKGGEDSVVYNEAELLASAGHEVDLLIFSNSGKTALKVAQLAFNLSSYQKTLRKVHEFKPDIIHVHNLHFAGSPSVLYAARKAKVPVVMTLHNYRLLCPSATLFFKGKLFTSSVNRIFALEAIKKGVYQDSKMITFWLALSGALHHLAGTWRIPEKYVVLGDNEKDIFQHSKLKQLADRMLVKPNFCYPYEQGKESKEDYYLYVGRLSAEKGINILLEAFKNMNVRLKIAGSGPMEAEVSAAATIYPNIDFLGLNGPDEIRKIIAGAKALIFTSVWFETFGMVIIEAFSCGVPVIASAIGEAQYLVKDGVDGLLFRSGDSADLINKIRYFETLDKDSQSKLGQNALKHYTENFTPKENLDKLTMIYNAARHSA
jgi:glycosyltransferase involved in cell wall biosynthesis